MSRLRFVQEELRAGRAVAVHLGRDKEAISWAAERGLFVRIDRRTRWGNPYPIGKRYGDRDAVCQLFEENTLPGLLSEIDQLRGKALGCWCAPQRCHGDSLARAANEQAEGSA